MDPALADHLVVAGVALVVVVVATPVVRWMAPWLGAVKVPGDRHIHTRPIPEIGGLAMLAGVVVALAVATRLDAFTDLFVTTSEPEAILLAAALIALIGVIDDTRGLTPGVKLAGQVAAAGTLVLFGVTINYVYVPLSSVGLFSLSPDAAALLTIAAVVAMVNAVNLVDGLDGLAAGVVAIASAALLTYVFATRADDLFAAATLSSATLVLAAVVGVCVGFLFFNFNPASIFMGDTGAMLLGLLLAASGVSAVGNDPTPTSTDFFVASFPVLIPALVLAVPFVDTALAIIRRLGSGQSLASADKKHLHHRLVEMGQSQKRAVLTIYAWSILLALLVVGPTFADGTMVLLTVGAGAAVLVAYQTVDAARYRRRRRAVEAAGNVVQHPRVLERSGRDRAS